MDVDHVHLESVFVENFPCFCAALFTDLWETNPANVYILSMIRNRCFVQSCIGALMHDCMLLSTMLQRMICKIRKAYNQHLDQHFRADVHVYVNVYVHVCAYLCLHACMYVRMCICIYTHACDIATCGNRTRHHSPQVPCLHQHDLHAHKTPKSDQHMLCSLPKTRRFEACAMFAPGLLPQSRRGSG